MDLNLRGKRVLITGASRGIGAQAARTFAEEGCRLRLAARNVELLDALAAELRSTYDVQVDVHPTDIRDKQQLAALAHASQDIDILINNAGDIPKGTLDIVDEGAFRHAWELKVFGFINLSRMIYAQMKSQGHGVIINDIGAAGEKFDADYICGSAGNAALMAFTRALGGKSLKDNIRVVGINPGPVRTDRYMTRTLAAAKAQFGDESRYPELETGMPLGRPAHPREIADMMAFLASDRSGYTTGVICTIDGGFSSGWS